MVNVAVDQGLDTQCFMTFSTMGQVTGLMHVILLTVKLVAANTCFKLLILSASVRVLVL